MAYRSSLDAKMSQSKCIGVWGMPHSQSVHCAWLPGTTGMCPVEYVRYWFIEYDSSSSSFLYIVHTTYVYIYAPRACERYLRLKYITCMYICIILYTEQVIFVNTYCLSIQGPQLKSKMAENFSLIQNM